MSKHNISTRKSNIFLQNAERYIFYFFGATKVGYNYGFSPAKHEKSSKMQFGSRNAIFGDGRNDKDKL